LEIEPRHVLAYLQVLADSGLAASTIRKLRAPLRALLATAAEDGVIRSNPAAGVRIPSNARVPEPRPRNVESDIIAAFRERLDEADLLILDTFVALGPRYSELAALKIASVVIEDDETWVAVTERFYKGIDKPKSRLGVRRVRLSPKLAARLRAQRARRLLSGASRSHPLFTSPRGARLTCSNLRRRWVPLMREVGIE
jgi:integrase